jgi:hypothetical protein
MFENLKFFIGGQVLNVRLGIIPVSEGQRIALIWQSPHNTLISGLKMPVAGLEKGAESED